MTTPPGSDEQTRMVVEELRLLRKSLNRIYMVLLIPLVLVGVYVAGIFVLFLW